MVSVTFKGVCPGTCSWCRKEKNEVFLVSDKTAHDPRPWCWGCLGKKVRLEVEGATGKPGGTLTSTGDGAPGRGVS